MKKGRNLGIEFKAIFMHEGVSVRSISRFRKMIYDHYLREGRPLPWRKTRNPYRILVSEIMLQQTQVGRVLDKYRLFIKAFPDFAALAEAPISDILNAWKGLGYNRRAISLKKIAETVVEQYGGSLPSDPEVLITLPGIGKYSAPAIYTFVTGRPSLFVETNIRRVYIHFFFQDRQGIGDEEIIPILEKTMDAKDPRQWYYALMDYGVKLKAEVENPNRRSAGYRKQSPFKGSARQVRGAILRALIGSSAMSKNQIKKRVSGYAGDIDGILACLVKEGFLEKKNERFRVP
ncbi:MAG: A/G-specific adenine glycosylase [Thermodesulfovibrionales bacterium]